MALNNIINGDFWLIVSLLTEIGHQQPLFA
jgi:hypothetical protein